MKSAKSGLSVRGLTRTPGLWKKIRMKSRAGFGMLELVISAAVISALCLFFLKMRLHDQATLNQAIQAHGLHIDPHANPTAQASDMAKAVGAQIEAIEKDHLRQTDCQIDKGTECK